MQLSPLKTGIYPPNCNASYPNTRVFLIVQPGHGKRTFPSRIVFHVSLQCNSRYLLLMFSAADVPVYFYLSFLYECNRYYTIALQARYWNEFVVVVAFNCSYLRVKWVEIPISIFLLVRPDCTKRELKELCNYAKLKRKITYSNKCKHVCLQ